MPVSLLVVLSLAVFFPLRSVEGAFCRDFKGQEIVSVSWILSQFSQVGFIAPIFWMRKLRFREV